MTEHIVSSCSPEEIGDLVASDFKDGEPYVHLKELPFAKSVKWTRARQTIAICERVGLLAQQLNLDPFSAIERLDNTSEPNLRREHFHTSGFSSLSAERFISYWNGQPLLEGDTIDILPMDRVVEHMHKLAYDKEPLMNDMLQRIEEDCEGDVRKPIYDPATGRVRFDKEVMETSDVGRVELFFNLIKEEERRLDDKKIKRLEEDEQTDVPLATSIELGGGEAIFFDNHKVLHRRTPSHRESRLAFRVLLHAFIDPSRADMDAHISVYL